MRTALALLIVGAALFGGAARAVDDTGTEADLTYEYEQHQLRDCTVYLYPTDGMGEVARVQSLGYSVTVGGDLSFANISQYDVLWLALVGPGVAGGAQSDIELFVNNGGGLYIHQPNGFGTIDYAPSGFEFTVSDVLWCDPEENNTIVTPGHPTMFGLSPADLVGRYDTVFTSSLGSGYTLLAEGTGACDDNVQSAAGTFGAGRVFADLGNSGGSASPGSDMYLTNLFEWLCVGGSTPTESTTWGEIKGLFR